jgi:exosortase/archaeosortase family protein
MIKKKIIEDSDKKVGVILVRYLFILIITVIFSFSNFFQNIFTAFTIQVTNFVLGFFFNSVVSGNKILLDSAIIELVPACIGVSVYLLFLILIFLMPLAMEKRIKIILFTFISFFVINLIRIVILGIILINNHQTFESIHKFIWYFLNVVIVLVLWFVGIYLLKIKEIPVYDDFKYILNFRKNR